MSNKIFPFSLYIFSEAQTMEMDKTDHVKNNELYQAFKVFDTDSDGFVTLEEFTKAMQVCLIFDLMHTLDLVQKFLKTLELETETHKVKNLFRELDGNNDDKVDFYEFVRLFQR